MKENNNTNSENLLIIDILNFIWLSRFKIVTITLFFIIVTFIYVMVVSPWYSAKVKLMPSDKSGSGVLSQYSNLAALAGINLNMDTGDKYGFYPDIIESNFILSRILEKKFKTRTFDRPVTLFTFWETEIDSSEPNWKHKLLEDSKAKLREEYIHSSLDKITNLLTIKVTVPNDPVLASEIANYIVEQLDIYNKKYRKYKATEQRKFIEKSIEDTKKELREAENVLKEFQENNKEISSPEKILQLERLKTEVEVQRAIYIELRKQLEIAKISEIKETETLNVLDEATVPVRKFKPKRAFILIVMTIIGFLTALIYIYTEKFIINLYQAFKSKKEMKHS